MFKNTSLPRVGGVVASTVMLFKLEHNLNAVFPIDVTLLGIVSDVKAEQPAKASSPMLVMPEGSSIDVKLRAFPSKCAGMDVNPDDKWIDVRDKLPLNANWSILVTLSGI